MCRIKPLKRDTTYIHTYVYTSLLGTLFRWVESFFENFLRKVKLLNSKKIHITYQNAQK